MSAIFSSQPHIKNIKYNQKKNTQNQKKKEKYKHIKTHNNSTRSRVPLLVHGRTPTSTSGLHQLPPALKRPISTRDEPTILRLDPTICVLDPLPIPFTGLISAGCCIHSHRCPSTNQKDIFRLGVVCRPRVW